MLFGQSTARTSRRRLLGATIRMSLGVAGVALAACGPAAATPAAAPPKPPGGSTPVATAAKPTVVVPTPQPAAPKPAATQAPAKPKTLAKVRSSQTAAGFETAYTLIGLSKGLYAEEGVDIEFVELADGVAQVKALISGETLLAMTGTNSVLPAIEKGADLKIVGAPRPRLNMVLYSRKEITKAEELYGKTIGIGNAGALLHQITLAYFDKAGLDASKLEFVNIGSSPNVFKAVLANKVVAGASTIDFIPTAEQDGNVRVLVNLAAELPQYLRSCFVTSTKFVSEQPDLLVRTMAGYAKSLRYGLEHGDEIVALAVKELGLSEAQAKFGHKTEVENRILGPNLEFTAEQIEWLQRVNVKTGEQQQILPFTQVATIDLQKQMIARIGRWEYK